MMTNFHKRNITFLFFISHFFILHVQIAQNKKILDSLVNVYKTSKYDTASILALTSIANLYRNNKPDTCISIAKEALKRSEKIGFERGKAWAYNRMGIGNFIKSNYNEAVIYLQNALDIYEKLKEKRNAIAMLGNIGNIYTHQGNYEKALQNFDKVLKINQKLDNKQGIAAASNNIGLIHSLQGRYNLAIEDYAKSLNIAKELKDQQGMAETLNNIGSIYESQGNYIKALETQLQSLKIYEEINDRKGIARTYQLIATIQLQQEKYNESLEYREKSLKISEELKDKRGISMALLGIGNIYYYQNNFAIALGYYQKALKIDEELKTNNTVYSLNNVGVSYIGLDKYEQGFEYLLKARQLAKDLKTKPFYAENARWIAESYLKMKKYEQAKEYANEAVLLNKELKDLKNINKASKVLYEVYKYEKNYVKALEYYEVAKQTQDTLFNVEKEKIILNLEARLELKEKTKEIELLNKNKVILEKDNDLKKIELERQKNAKLAIEKQAEADKFFALAQEEKNKHKQDSLFILAQKKQSEADNLKAKELQLSAENKTKQVEIMKAKEASIFQWRFIYLVTFALLCVCLLSYFIYLSQQNEKKSKELIAIQKEEIQVQAENLQELNQVKDRLFAIISHDLRSPLAQLQGVLSLVEMDLINEKELKQIIPEIQKNVRFTSELTSNLLNWSNSQLEGINYNPEFFDVYEIAENKISLFEKTAQQKGIILKNLIPQNTEVYADKNMIDLVIRNLAANAVKFCEDKDFITIQAKTQQDFLRIEVKDTGIGIAPENISKLFGQTNFTTRGTSNEKGTGLGLNLCKDFVTRNRGQIGVESEQGKGSCFYFLLPTKEILVKG